MLPLTMFVLMILRWIAEVESTSPLVSSVKTRKLSVGAVLAGLVICNAKA